MKNNGVMEYWSSGRMSTGKTKAMNGDFLKTESGGQFPIYLLDNISGDPLLYRPIILLLNQSWLADFFG
jgi:hypothetical protein